MFSYDEIYIEDAPTTKCNWKGGLSSVTAKPIYPSTYPEKFDPFYLVSALEFRLNWKFMIERLKKKGTKSFENTGGDY
jgi:hypothetical protein